MRFVHISDLHLGKTFPASRYGPLAQRRRRELTETFSRLVDYVNENQVDFILCSGDLLNSEELRVEELRNINAIIDRLERAVLVAICGNHDPLTENSAFRKIQWSPHFYLAPPGVGRVALSSYKTIITYHSWNTKELAAPPDQLLHIAAQPNSGNYQILMLHADALDPNSAYLPIDPKALADKGFDYVALGHIHKPTELAPNIRYPGSLEPLDFGEMGPHGFLLVEMEGQRRRCQFIPFAMREYRSLSIETAPQDSELAITKRITAAILRRNPQHIYAVELTGTHPDGAGWDLGRIEEELWEQSTFCSITDNTRPAYQLDALYRENRGNLLGDFIESFGTNPASKLERRALELGIDALKNHAAPRQREASVTTNPQDTPAKEGKPW